MMPMYELESEDEKKMKKNMMQREILA